MPINLLLGFMKVYGRSNMKGENGEADGLTLNPNTTSLERSNKKTGK